MGTTVNFNVPLTIEQLAEMVRQLTKPEKIQLAEILQNEAKQSEKESTETHFASQNVLAQDWLNQEEEKAWQHL